jgi:hypothetical protein
MPDPNMPPVAGLRLVEDPTMVERVQHSRSAARARRRAKLGHPQHHIIRPCQWVRVAGGTMLAHPQTAAELRAELKRRMEAGHA